MVKLIGNYVWRGGEKVGWIDGNHVRDSADKRLGYFEDRFVYDMNGHRIAHIDQDYLVSEGGMMSEAKIRLDEIAENVQGGVIPEIGRCAVYILLGD
jgi:4-fold beta-flower domain-containing protein